MKRMWHVQSLVGLMACAICIAGPSSSESDEIHFEAVDGIVVHGDFYRSPDGKEAPIILLFHQAGRNARAEYGPLVSHLLEKKINVLAIDQRSGGSFNGMNNRTVEKLNGKAYSYCEAYTDLEASLAYVVGQGYTGKLIVWGSSYSAALVIQLAAKNPDRIDGILAFSPASGGPMVDCRAAPYLENLGVPLLVLRPQREMAIESAQRQAELIRKHGHGFYVAKNGVHGSSMLNPELVEGSVDENWHAVMSFIDKVLNGD